MKHYKWSVCILLHFFSCIVLGQDIKLTAEQATQGYYYDYNLHGETLYSLYPETLYGLQWLKNSDYYFHNTGEQLVFTDANTHKEVGRFSIDGEKRISVPMYADEKELVFSHKVGIVAYHFSSQEKLYEIPLPQNAENLDYQPQNKMVAYTVDNNLFVATPESNVPITSHSDKNIVAGASIHRNEFGISKGTFWSPNGNYLAFYQKDESLVSDYPLLDVSKLGVTVRKIKYPMAGQGSERASVGIYNISSNKLIYLDIDTTDEHYLTNLSWSPDEKYVLLAEVNRAQNHYSLNYYDALTGKKVGTLWQESNDKWVEPEHPAVFLPNSNDTFLWLSEKDGFTNIYKCYLSGMRYKQLTHFKWEVREILGFDDKDNVFVSGSGDDARELHTFKINLKNPNKYKDLTPNKGTHQTQLSSDGTYLLDKFSSIQTPQNISVINTKSGLETMILKAKNPLEGYDIARPELLSLKADDGTTLYAVMHKPKHFDPNKKYPVLVYVYGGPHAQLVTNSWLAGSALWHLAFASTEDYIVFTLDNRGSAHRGFAFESVIHRQLGEIEMKDQLTGVNYLKSLPYVDSSRIAVTGWSFGGFMTSSLMLRNPGVFNVAVAGGAVTDWRLYEVMYGERYMDTPEENPQGYKISRVGQYLPNLKGKLMFIHGGIDDVVVPQHVLSVIEEAVKKQVQIDFFEYPSHKHNVRGKDRAHLNRKIWDYIVQHNKKKEAL